MVDPQSYGLLWAIPSLVLFCGGLALFTAASMALASVFWRRDSRRILVFATCFFAGEWARSVMFTGLPWNLPAYIWPAGGPVSQTASVLGAYGLSLLTLVIAAAPAALADGGKSMGVRAAPMIAGALALGLLWGAGVNRLANTRLVIPGETPVVRVADSGLSQAEKWADAPDQEEQVLARYLRASGLPNETNAQIIVWPEGAIPTVNFYLLENPALLGEIGAALRDRVLILGLTRREERYPETLHYNSAAVIDGVSGTPRLSQIYDKHHLVPFGEYIPFYSSFSSALSGLRRLGLHVELAPLQQIGVGFTPGQEPSRVVIPGAAPALIYICYEAIFPGAVPNGAERPAWLIAVSNDAWFGGGQGPAQHFNIARYRSIEEGLPMARAASGGVSGIVDAYGRVMDRTQDGRLFAEAQLPATLPPTIAARWGDQLTALLFLVIAAMGIFGRRALRAEGRGR